MLNFWRSTVGKKVVMGATGLILVAWIIAHLVGNLTVFAGPGRMNGYAAFLRSTGELLWLMRVILLAAVLLHITAAVQLTRIDRAARQVRYDSLQPQSATLASRTMRVGGVVILLFVIFHLLHLTTGTIQPAPFSEQDVYRNVIGGFRIWWVSLIYIVALIALGLHIFHGGWSATRTLGIGRPAFAPGKRKVAITVAVLIWLGFTVIPVAVLAGWVR